MMKKKKMTASDTNSVGERGVPVSNRGGGVAIHVTVSDNNSLNTCTQLCFLLLVRLLVLPMFFFIAFNSPNLTHQHWKGKKTVKCPNNLD